eukprot:GILI01001479.1.p1 GENE.GILI01001479.1~~GILI01001479.1.p1  ORF type:complete len:236 (-),score=55.17 GILI01001479.1:148-807(-)
MSVQPQGTPMIMIPAIGGIVNAMYIPDTQRNPKHHPGRFIYSAQFDHEKLICLYKCMTFPFCCGLEEMARETHYDVYSNSVMFSQPTFFSSGPDCCLGRPAWGLTRYYDHPVFDAAVTTGPLCKGGCLLAVLGYTGKFGDQLNHHVRCLNTCEPSGLAHISIISCPEGFESVYGLKDHEGARLASIINDQVRIFRQNPTAYALDANALSATTQPLPKMA